MLFLIYINDVSNSADQRKFCLFTDDTHMLYADKNLQPLETIVNVELSNVYDWLTANKLSLNIKKSNFVIFRPRQKKLNYEVNSKVFDYHTNKYLGVLIDENLSWKYRIVHLASKVSKTIGIIARLRHFVPLATLHRIYISLIHPYLLLYGIVAWDRAAKNKILILQKRALRLMCFW